MKTTTKESNQCKAKPPPRALRGRWGSFDRVESHIVDALPWVPEVILDVVAGSMSAEVSKKQKKAAVVVK